MEPIYFQKQLFNNNSIVELRKIVQRHVDEATINENEINASKLAHNLICSSMDVARKYLTVAENEDCRTRYDARANEYLLWVLGILCACWSAEIFRHKTIDGVCHAHQTPCHKGSELHYQLHAELIDSFEHLIKLLKEMPVEIKGE